MWPIREKKIDSCSYNGQIWSCKNASLRFSYYHQPLFFLSRFASGFPFVGPGRRKKKYLSFSLGDEKDDMDLETL